MPYKYRDSQAAYRKGYRAGARRIVLAYFGGKCADCGTDNIRVLEISHMKPVRKSWRDYTDWLDKDNIRILCKTCNMKEENDSRRADKMVVEW